MINILCYIEESDFVSPREKPFVTLEIFMALLERPSCAALVFDGFHGSPNLCSWGFPTL